MMTDERLGSLGLKVDMTEVTRLLGLEFAGVSPAVFLPFRKWCTS